MLLDTLGFRVYHSKVVSMQGSTHRAADQPWGTTAAPPVGHPRVQCVVSGHSCGGSGAVAAEAAAFLKDADFAGELQKAEIDPFEGSNAVVFRAGIDWGTLKDVLDKEPSTVEEEG